MLGIAVALLMSTNVVTAVETNYQAAYSAAETGKPMLVLVGTNWCPGCVSMKRHTIPALARAGKLRGVAYAEVDADAKPVLARKLMSGGTYPQFVLYRKTKKGWKSTRLIGTQSPKTLEVLIDRAVEAQKTEFMPVSAEVKK